MALGSFCLVLHGHLPYVLRHGTWPHGEDWLYEAAAETYLPLAATIRECEFLKGNPRLTMGITPVLLEQFAHPHFQKGFEDYLADRVERAKSDHADFERDGQLHLAYLATRWEQFYQGLGEQFAALGRNIPAAFVELAQGGLIEILTSSATHAALPLLMEDSSLRAQVRAGLATSQRILGFRPSGMWLPECAYRPCGQWTPPIPWGQQRYRPGIEQVVADEGITHFFVENHLIEGSLSEWALNGQWQKVGWDEAQRDPGRGWRSVNEPAWVQSDGSCQTRTAAFGRDPKICEQVWSGTVGYPGNGTYLEFHKKQGQRRGLRYWKVTGRELGLGDKQPYYPDDVPGRIHEHVVHFCNGVRDRLREYRQRTNRHGVVVACFDAELFGHWWFEGPRFVRDVLLMLNADPEVEVCTTAEYLQRHSPDKIVKLPEGTWGEGGDYRVWVNPKVNWMWEVEYRAEALFGKLTFNLPWRQHADLRKLLEKAGRELLLLQASDWPFVISRGQAVDYGIKRFVQHVARFETLMDLAERLGEDPAHNGKLTEVEKFEVKDADIHDVIFPHIDLEWWNT